MAVRSTLRLDLAATGGGVRVTYHVQTLEELGTLLYGLRRDSGKSLRVLAQLTGFNPATLGAWENGKHWPLTHKLGELLNWYGVTVTIGRRPGGGGEK